MKATTNDPRRATGTSGEELAANYLVGRGWWVLDRNWRCRNGELDIIAWDPDGVLVICEVKTRRGLGYGDPLEAITLREGTQAARVGGGSGCGLQTSRSPRVRLDAIGVVLRRDGRAGDVTHVRGIDA